MNAQINVSQKTLDTNEKLAFVDRYEQELNAVQLGEALGLSPSQVQKYKATAKLPKDVREKFVQVRKDMEGVRLMWKLLVIVSCPMRPKAVVLLPITKP